MRTITLFLPLWSSFISSGYLCLLTDFQCCKARSYHYWWIGWLSQFVGICLFGGASSLILFLMAGNLGIGTHTDLVNILLELATNKDRFKLGQLTSSSICSICLYSMETQSARSALLENIFIDIEVKRMNLYQISAHAISLQHNCIIGKRVLFNSETFFGYSLSLYVTDREHKGFVTIWHITDSPQE